MNVEGGSFGIRFPLTIALKPHKIPVAETAKNE
jgi:hypothetical protein